MTQCDTTLFSTRLFCPGLPSFPISSPLILVVFSAVEPSLFHAPAVPRVFAATRLAASSRHVFTHHFSSLSWSPCVTLFHTHCRTRYPFLFPFCLSRCHSAALMVTLRPNAASGLVCSTAGSGAPWPRFPSHCPYRCTAGTAIPQQVRVSHIAARFEYRPSALVASRASSRRREHKVAVVRRKRPPVDAARTLTNGPSAA